MRREEGKGVLAKLSICRLISSECMCVHHTCVWLMWFSNFLLSIRCWGSSVEVHRWSIHVLLCATSVDAKVVVDWQAWDVRSLPSLTVASGIIQRTCLYCHAQANAFSGIDSAFQLLLKLETASGALTIANHAMHNLAFYSPALIAIYLSILVASSIALAFSIENYCWVQQSNLLALVHRPSYYHHIDNGLITIFLLCTSSIFFPFWSSIHI